MEKKEAYYIKGSLKKKISSTVTSSHISCFIEMYWHNTRIYPLFRSLDQFKIKLSNKNSRIK